jgi:hypothetical protein
MTTNSLSFSKAPTVDRRIASTPYVYASLDEYPEPFEENTKTPSVTSGRGYQTAHSESRCCGRLAGKPTNLPDYRGLRTTGDPLLPAHKTLAPFLRSNFRFRRPTLCGVPQILSNKPRFMGLYWGGYIYFETYGQSPSHPMDCMIRCTTLRAPYLMGVPPLQPVGSSLVQPSLVCPGNGPGDCYVDTQPHGHRSGCSAPISPLYDGRVSLVQGERRKDQTNILEVAVDVRYVLNAQI